MRDTLGRLGRGLQALALGSVVCALGLPALSSLGPPLERSFLGRAHASELQDQWRMLQEAQAAHQRGRQAQASGDAAAAESALMRAAELYRAVLDRNPLRTELYAPLADILVRRGQPQVAYALVSQQLQKGVTDLGLRVQLARALLAMKRPQRALELAQPLRREAPGNLGVAALIGELAAEVGDGDLAIAELSRALTRPLRDGEFPEDTDIVSIHKRLGRLLVDRKQATEALPHLALVIKARPRDGEALRLQGEALLAAGQPAAAVETLRRADATDTEAQALLGLALAASGELPAGLSLLEKAGDSPAVLHARGLLLARKQPPELDAADQALARAATAQPTSAAYCIDHAQILLRRHQVAAALAEIDRCAPADGSARAGAPLTESEVQDALAIRIEVAGKLGKLDEAIAGLRAAIKGLASGPSAASATTKQKAALLKAQLARALLRRGIQRLPATSSPPAAGTATQALAELEESRALAPGNEVEHAYALALLLAGKADEAVKRLAPLAQASPSDVRVQGAYGRALRETGQLAEALTVFDRAEALLPGATPPAPAPPPPGTKAVAPAPKARPTGPQRPGAKPAAAATPALVEPQVSPEVVVLRSALRAEQAVTLMALRRPVDALKRLDLPDETSQRLRAQAYLQTVRALYETFQAGQVPNPQPGLPLPPSQQVPAGQPIPPPDPQAVLFMTQTALKIGPVVPPVERAEAKLWQVVALVQRGQFELASKLVGEIAGLFDAPTLESLLGRGGFAHLQARATLKGGEFYQGVAFAQQAMSLLPPEAVRGLRTFLAIAYTSKAADLYDRSEPERVLPLLRAAQAQTQGGSPLNIARAKYNLAALSLQRGKLEEARALLQTLDPQLVPESLIGLGLYHDLGNDAKTALDFYRRYVLVASALPPPPLVAAPAAPATPVPPGGVAASPVPVVSPVELVKQWIDVLSRIYEGPARTTGSLMRSRRSG